MAGNDPSYFIRWRGRSGGPFPLHVIEDKLAMHEFGLWHEILDHGSWKTLEQFLSERKRSVVPEMKAKAAPPTGHAPRGFDGLPQSAGAATAGSVAAAESTVPAPGRRRWIVFGGLALVAGFLGLHNFYAGFLIRGGLQLMLTVITSVAGYGIIVPWAWAWLEAVLVRRDAAGLRMN